MPKDEMRKDKKFSRVMFSCVHDNWATPKDVYESLNNEFHFDDDPCPLHGSGGLDRDWGTSVFVNPPYSDIKSWMEKGYSEAQKGKTVVFLIPSRTDTKWFHKYCIDAEIRFIKGRLKFGDAKNSAPFPSMIVILRRP